MKTVALAHRELGDEERTLLYSVGETLGVHTPADALEPISAMELAQTFPDPDARLHVAQLLIFTALIDGTLSAEERRVIDDFAAELGVEDDNLHDFRLLATHHLDTLRRDMVRRSPFPRGTISDSREDHEGWRGLWQLFRAATEPPENLEDAWRFKQLGLMPETSFGRIYWAHMTERRFLFPGERGASMPKENPHDFLHVLTGYNTDDPGELELSAFSAGMSKREDPFGMLFGTQCMLHLGRKLREPYASLRAAPQSFNTDRIARAYRRGLLATVDLVNDGWEIQSDLNRPLDELRRDYNIHIV